MGTGKYSIHVSSCEKRGRGKDPEVDKKPDFSFLGDGQESEGGKDSPRWIGKSSQRGPADYFDRPRSGEKRGTGLHQK